jgi:hypothetical protein
VSARAWISAPVFITRSITNQFLLTLLFDIDPQADLV